MQKLRGSPGIIVLLFYFICLWSQVAGFCPMRCECNDENLYVNCTTASLGFVPITLNPELRELYLGNNHIKTIGSAFNVYHNLEFLDMSHNQLTVDKDSFIMLENLKVFFLNRNMISSIKNDTFQGLVALNTLHLSENLLEEVQSRIFVHLQQLEVLDLCQNHISVIHTEAFYNLKLLKVLLLRNNKLTIIPSSSFQYIPKLVKLDLGLNSFHIIPEESFSKVNSLQELLLDGCGIENIQNGAFKWLSSLLILHIHDNELTEVPTKALLDVIHLENLHIGQNKFHELKAKSFQRLAFLHTVEINSCQFLQNVDKRTFTDNPNVKTIVISHNKALRYIQEGAFDNLHNIQNVNFRGNAFETLQQDLLPWDDLQLLDVRDNPLVCNCSLFWLWKLLVTKNFSSFDGHNDVTQVVCENPPGVKNKLLSSLTQDNLDCYSLDAKRKVIISVIIAATMIFAVIIILGFRCRDKLAGILKTKWGRGRKEPVYQKTSADEESTILQAAQQSLKMTPVTEL